MAGLVKIVGKEVYTDTLIMSDGFDIKHNAILKLIIKYKERLETKGTLSREIQKSGGRPTTYYLLNENQAIFIASLMRNSEKVVDFKDELSNQFVNQKNILMSLLAQSQNAEWLEKRNAGKLTHRVKTDVIKDFIEYCRGMGSQSPKKYYINLAKMENAALFLLQEKYPNVRDVLNGHQLSVIQTADQIVAKALKEGMIDKLFYKDIYKLAKKRVLSMAELIGKSVVPLFDQKQIL